MNPLRATVTSLMRVRGAVCLLGLLRSRIIQLFALAQRPAATGYSVVINTTGSGNIGDQALFESFLANVPGHVVAVCERDDSFAVPSEHASRVTIVALDSLIYGWGLLHLRDHWVLGGIIRGASSVWITGADIMDGGYNQRLSSTRWMIALATRALNKPARILGFSWNDHPDPGILQLARRAGRAGVVSFARDPQSYARLVADGVPRVELVADVAFAMGEPEPLPAQLESRFDSWRDPQQKLALFNISGLISANTTLDEDHRQVVIHLREAGYQVMLVPHVIREGNDDLAAADRVFSSPEFGDVFALTELLAPRQISQLSSRADLVFTGRMHLAVLALGQGVPVIVMSTQGKVTGLMEMFAIAHHSIEPVPGFAEVVRPLSDPASLETFRRNYSDGIRFAHTRSQRNFAQD